MGGRIGFGTEYHISAALRRVSAKRRGHHHIGLQMQETIRRIMENMIYKSGQEVDMTMTANIIETLKSFGVPDEIINAARKQTESQ
jgi:hypothetical protein